MPIDYSSQVYLHAYNVFARDITVIPLASQPGQLPYSARGIFDTRSIDVVALDGSIISEHRTILDIREAEFTVLPSQKDRVIIPADGTIPEAGTYEVIDSNRNGGGETTLTLHRYVEPKPLPR